MLSETEFQKLNEAITLAVESFAGRVDEETGQPAILHSMETLQLLSDMQAEASVQIAGVLLHTVEIQPEDRQSDALNGLAEQFGNAVADMIALQTKDFSQIWAIQNTGMLQKIQGATEQDKMLFFADQLSALRVIRRRHRLDGEDMWNRWLKTSKEKYAWFANGVLECSNIFAEGDFTADYYKEMADLYKDLFVTYTIDPTFTVLYQTNAFGQAHCLTKGTASWVPAYHRFRQEDIPLSRKEAESLEEKWYDIILQQVEADCAMDFAVEANGLLFRFEEAVVSCTDKASGQTISFYEEESYDLLLRLREQFGVSVAPEEMVAGLLEGLQNPFPDFLQLCSALGLHPTM